MDTVKFDKVNNPVKMVERQGLYGPETGNTCAGFVSAENRSCRGECDVHVTGDSQLAVIHHDNPMSISGENFQS
ncbi:MAG: hypothetical protein IJW00_02975 [Clostridia bacterium]|nr:hypothetical protein [Clostridia bacterium]